MDTESKAITAITTIVIFIIAYIISKDYKKNAKDDPKESDNLISSSSVNHAVEYTTETEEQFYERCKSHIENYLNKNEYQFFTSNSSPVFLIPFDATDSVFEIVITPYYNGNARVIEFTANITSVAVQDNMLSAIAELTNRINTVSINSPIYLDYEARQVKICKALMVSHFDIDSKMFDWYFRSVLDAGRIRAYLNRVLLHEENPALVALDYAHT